MPTAFVKRADSAELVKMRGWEEKAKPCAAGQKLSDKAVSAAKRRLAELQALPTQSKAQLTAPAGDSQASVGLCLPLVFAHFTRCFEPRLHFVDLKW